MALLTGRPNILTAAVWCLFDNALSLSQAESCRVYSFSGILLKKCLFNVYRRFKILISRFRILFINFLERFSTHFLHIFNISRYRPISCICLGSALSTSKNVYANDQHRRRATTDDHVSSTLSSQLAVFRALQTASWSTEQPSSTSSSPGIHRRRLSRRRRPSGRRHRDRQEHRVRSAELRRLARIALKKHIRT